MSRAIAVSISIVTLIYLFVNVAYFAVMSKEEIIESQTIASTFSKHVLNKNFQWLVPLTVALTVVSGLNGFIFASSRIVFVGARNGHLFSALKMVNINHLTPIPSLLFIATLSCFYLFSTSIISLINYFMFLDTLFSAISVSTMIALRKKMPNLTRPIKISLLIPTIYILMCAYLIILPIWIQPMKSLIGICFVFLGVPIYYLTANWKNKPCVYQNTIDKLNNLTQYSTLSVIPDTDTKIIHI